MSSRLTTASLVQLHQLHFRRDGEEWIVGRLSGEFVAVSGLSVFVLRQLERGRSIAGVQQLVAKKFGHTVDVRAFVKELVSLGFVASIDGRRLRDRSRKRVTLARVQSRHVGWLVGIPALSVVALVIVFGVEALVISPAVRPRSSYLFWSPSVTVNLVSGFFAGWLLVFVHELAHLCTARAYGIPGNITLGTRLQFLVAQTNVNGVWSLPRNRRLTVYLAGIVADVFVAAIAVLIRYFLEGGTEPAQFLGAVVIFAVGSIPFEFFVFMRTDMYFVLQDALSCRNLAHDGWAYINWNRRRMVSLLRRGVTAGVDPSSVLARSERTAVRIYALFLLVGTAACVGFAVFVSIPAGLQLIHHSLSQMRSADVADRVDGAVSVTLSLFFVFLWAIVWWGTNGQRIVSYVRRLSTVRSLRVERAV
jgi:putative peptide zinc metalloprotease protein